MMLLQKKTKTEEIGSSPRTQVEAPHAEPHDVLLVLRVPPPFGGGEVIALALRDHLAGKFSVLSFSRSGVSKQTQGKFRLNNLGFGLRYVLMTDLKIISLLPKVVFLDLPKDTLSFVRTSCILLPCFVLRIRVIGDLAGEDFEFLRRKSLARGFGLMVLKRVSVVRVLSPSIAAALKRHGLNNLVSISNGIAEPPLCQSERGMIAGGIQFLYVGKLALSKGIMTIVEFTKQYMTRGRPFHVNLVGEWENTNTETSVREYIAAHRLEGHLSFHGLLVGTEKWAVYRAAHILLHPTYWDGQPVTILEAFAFGLPVIATGIGAIPDTLEDGVNGYLMKENSAGEICAGVERIVPDTTTYQRFAVQARKSYDEHFRLELFLTKLENLIMGVFHDATSRPVPEDR